jgi:thymidylate kinase
VRDTFLNLAAAEPATWAVIDASRCADEVAADVENVVREQLGHRGLGLFGNCAVEAKG